jgi:hypothetical protein
MVMITSLACGLGNLRHEHMLIMGMKARADSKAIMDGLSRDDDTM